MYLIDKPFVSDFLINKIRNNNFQLIATKVAKELINDDSLAWIDEDKANSILNNSQTFIYSNSESALV
jgi:AAA15 family ATPase/GTPase